MFSLFTRNYVGTFIGLVFFGLMFFSNLDMVFQSNSILTENGIPNFVWWLLPMMLFLYFWMFFILQNRLLFGCKKVKKSLKLLFLLVSILYSVISIVLLYFSITSQKYLVILMWVTILLAFKNFYYHIKVKHKQYFGKLRKKVFLKELSVYGIVIILSLIVFTRPLNDISIPEWYFKINIQSLEKQNNPAEVVLQEVFISQYLQKIALKNDQNADYRVITYNFPEDILKEINNIYTTTIDFPELNKNINYSYSHLVNLQKVNLLKYQYNMLHKDYEAGIEIMKNILEVNKKMNNSHINFINFIDYVSIQQETVENIEMYIKVLSAKQREYLLSYLDDINLKVIWKEALEKEFNYRLSSIAQLYNIPLLLDKTEVLNGAIYIEYLKSENLIDTNKDIKLKSITRKNYFWLWFLEETTTDLEKEYKQLIDLSENIKTLKNTLN